MPNSNRPLWRIWLEITGISHLTSLTCAECYAVLEYLADADLAGIDHETLFQAARQHLADCPDCQEFYRKRLDEWAALQTTADSEGEEDSPPRNP